MATSNPVHARRGSLVGPVILVLIGAAFLWQNLRPDFSVWHLAARYWPLLLIVWGVARVFEYVAARATSRPVPRTFGAGDVFLAIFICLAGATMFAFERGDWQPLRITRRGLEVLGQSYEFPVQGAKPIPPDATVWIQNPYGNVQVRGTDSKEIQIQGRKSIRAFTRESAQKDDEATRLEIVIEDKGRVIVRTNQDNIARDRLWDRRITTDLEITLPKTAAIRIESRLGDCEVRDVAGPVDIDGRNAGVRLDRKSTRLNSSHIQKSRMPSSA